MSGSIELLTDLVKDAIRRIDLMGDKLDHKLDQIENKFAQDQKVFKDSVEDRIEKLEDQVTDNTHKIVKFEHSANIMVWLISGGIASFAGLLSWAAGWIKIQLPH